MFKITGDKKTFTKPRNSTATNGYPQIFEKSFTAGSDVNLSMSMNKNYQNYEGKLYVGERKNS